LVTDGTLYGKRGNLRVGGIYAYYAELVRPRKFPPRVRFTQIPLKDSQQHGTVDLPTYVMSSGNFVSYLIYGTKPTKKT